jgi:hypothetical protein
MAHSKFLSIFADKISKMDSVATQKTESNTHKIVNIAVKYILPIILTVALVWYMFSKVSFSDMMQVIRNGVDYKWILLAMIISIFSHIFRAMRWRLQLNGLSIRPPFTALCCSIFGTYALNLLFPRLGEVWRCAYISKVGKASFTKVLGSMVADRLSDTVTVLLLTILTFVLAHNAIATFMTKYAIGRDALNLLSSPLTWIIIIVCILVVWGIFHFYKSNKLVVKIRGMFQSIWEGFSVVAKMKGKGKFLFLTLCIWGCYFFQLYVAFYAFSFTASLCHESSLAFGLLPCLVAFIFSSIGMAIPSNGGLGPWNIAIIFGLSIYGIADSEGTTFSMLVWSAQTVMLIILGIYALIYIFSRKNHKNIKHQ